jgi:hypothetical protein
MLKLITLLTSGIPAIVAAIVSFIVRKVGTAAGAIALYIAVTAAFIACINSILQSVLAILSMPVWVSNAIGMFMPADFAAVMAAVVSSRICRAAYDMAVMKNKIINDAS